MTRLTQDELKAAQRIFNNVNTLCGNYFGRKTIGEIQKFVSLNRWIMFPVFNVGSLREGASYPAPNIYVAFDGDIVDDGKGHAESEIGVTYNNTESMLWLDRVLKVNNAPFFISTLNGLGPDWGVNISQKIKTTFKDNTPEYRTIETFDASTVTIDDIKKGISKSNSMLLQSGDDYPFPDGHLEPVIWCVTIFNVSINSGVNTFDRYSKEAFDLFMRILTLR